MQFSDSRHLTIEDVRKGNGEIYLMSEGMTPRFSSSKRDHEDVCILQSMGGLGFNFLSPGLKRFVGWRSETRIPKRIRIVSFLCDKKIFLTILRFNQQMLECLKNRDGIIKAGFTEGGRMNPCFFGEK